ncbi:hypothetical protein DOTSEDRAFT_75179 [Dothistroma septosporum NZE10]|uniref:Uncharacterized protein n=1 Tax=Dothistroma septosporum (strain NZE10 / CBS 128990) TaxID=675120 RepID=M2YKK2_DOTSN|nr:hypothetical protein DOTSEDRAFT_75179 [Dothistroma septosporum NZE10]
MKLLSTILALTLLHAVEAVPDFLLERQESPLPFTTGTPTSSGNVAPTLTGAFTANNGGGVYGVTSESGYVQIAGHQLTVGGAAALVGGDVVTLASGGVVANGATVALSTYTSSSSSAMSSSSSGGSTTASGSGSAMAQAASSTSRGSSAMAMATAVPVMGAAMVGGVLGLMVM